MLFIQCLLTSYMKNPRVGNNQWWIRAFKAPNLTGEIHLISTQLATHSVNERAYVPLYSLEKSLGKHSSLTQLVSLLRTSPLPAD